MLWDALQPSQPYDHPTARAPKTHKNQRRFRPLLVLKPRRTANPHLDQQVVQDAFLRIKDPYPQDGGRHRRHDGGQIKERAIDGHALNFIIQQHGNAQAHQHPQGNAHRHKQGVPQRFIKQWIARKHRDIILQPHEFRRRQHIIFTKAHK